MSDDHDFELLDKAEFFDAGDEGLAVRLQTELASKVGMPLVLGFLLDEKRGRLLLKELSKCVEQKWGTTH